MSLTSQQAKEFLRSLNLKVQAGIITKEEAKKLAVEAVSEIKPAGSAEDETPPQGKKPAREKQPPAKWSTAEESSPPAQDPKTHLISLLTTYEQAQSLGWKNFEHKVTALLRGTEGAAMPLGDYSIGVGDSSVKFTITQEDKSTLSCSYNARRSWDISGLTLPTTPVTSSLEKSCHLPLRKEVYALAEDILENSENELNWKKFKLPVISITKARETATSANDPRLSDILGSVPSEASFSESKAWRQWALAAQVCLLGSDYCESKGFEEIVAEFKE